MNILLILLRLLDGSSKYVPHSARLLDTLAYARRAPVIFFFVSVRPHVCTISSAHTRQIFVKFDI